MIPLSIHTAGARYDIQSSNIGMSTMPPISDTRYHSYLPIAPPKVTPGTEIIIALMGVTGKIRCLFKTCIRWLI